MYLTTAQVLFKNTEPNLILTTIVQELHSRCSLKKEKKGKEKKKTSNIPIFQKLQHFENW